MIPEIEISNNHIFFKLFVLVNLESDIDRIYDSSVKENEFLYIFCPFCIKKFIFETTFIYHLNEHFKEPPTVAERENSKVNNLYISLNR